MDIEFYTTTTGVQPFVGWLERLRDKKAWLIIRKRLQQIKEGDHLGHYRGAGAGVLELKIDYGPGYRLYCGMANQKLIIMLCGGDKSAQQKDIEKAREYWNDWKSRN